MAASQLGRVRWSDPTLSTRHTLIIALPLVRFFGRLHIHPCSGAPKDYPEFHLVYRDGKSVFNYEQDTRLTSSVWHSDVCTSFVSLPFSS